MRINNKGFTLIELLVAIGIIGMFALLVSPNILNSLETRDLENSARNVMTTFQSAKFRAVKDKLNHRVRFDNLTGIWRFVVEREDIPGFWNEIPGVLGKTISSKYNVTVNLPTPDLAVVFSPLGFVTNFDKDKNNITIQSDKLDKFSQPDQREVFIFAGGTFKYLKSESGG